MELSLLYVWMRQRAPESVARWLHRCPLLVMIARYLDSKRPSIVPLPPPLNGLRAHVDPSYGGWAYVQHEPHICRVIQDVVKPGWTVVDLGAHIGYFSLLLAKCVGPTGKVFAFEPLPSNVALLRENVALNSYEDIIRVEAQAVTDASGFVDLHDGPTPFQASMVWYQGNAGRIVPACSLDDFFRPQGFPQIDFQKVDVEGAESLVIAGMETILTQSKPVLLLELHGEAARPGLERLIEANYQLWSIGWEMEIKRRNPSMTIGHEHCLAVPESEHLESCLSSMSDRPAGLV